ncbi:hypothetical protein Bcer98_2209 [Bacillus cytotoxicus NVH 391-98]|uniref:Peptidase M4 C-terminal domain-containing protein n=2 Tax=Bacillus cytotoxicus TaxID=580165 RepID=A7GQQ1_BACCN|nr:hypothetical protein Bcer98_2209 [Bacillus cytotoxicus NVH 391-98]
MQGIGEDKMFNIFYYANTDELNMTSNFKELKVACIRVATNLYGENLAEVQAVPQAFKSFPTKKGAYSCRKIDFCMVVQLKIAYHFLSRY